MFRGAATDFSEELGAVKTTLPEFQAGATHAFNELTRVFCDLDLDFRRCAARILHAIHRAFPRRFTD